VQTLVQFSVPFVYVRLYDKVYADIVMDRDTGVYIFDHTGQDGIVFMRPNGSKIVFSFTGEIEHIKV
jgi:hypothetical protein